MNQKKLVQLFSTYMNQTVSPLIQNHPNAQKEWNHISKIISDNPIDYSQVDMYLYMANKQNQNRKQDNIRSEDKYSVKQTKSHEEVLSPTISYKKKKQFFSNLQSFQRTLMKNQQQLQNFKKKDSSSINLSTNNSVSTNYVTPQLNHSRKYI